MVPVPWRLWQISNFGRLRTQETDPVAVLLSDCTDKEARSLLAQGRLQGDLRRAQGGFRVMGMDSGRMLHLYSKPVCWDVGPFALHVVTAHVNSVAADGMNQCPSMCRPGSSMKLPDSMCWEEGILAYTRSVRPNILCSVRPVAKIDPPPAARIYSAIKGEVVSSHQKVQTGPGNQVSPNCFQIFLKTLAGASGLLWVKNTDTVLDWKQSIMGKYRYPGHS